MWFLLSSAVKDLKWRFSDPFALLIWIGIPLMLGSLLGMMGGGGAQPKAKVLLVDQDDTFVSNLLANTGSSVEDFPIELEKVELEEGRKRIDAGEATALLVLPEGFAQAVLEEKPLELQLFTNPSQTILPKIVEETLDIMVEGLFYLQRLMGDTLSQMSAGPPDGDAQFSNEAIAAMSVGINERIAKLQGIVFPPVLTVENEVGEKESVTDIGFGLLFLPGILFMSLVFVAQGVSDDLWKEKDQGTLRRIVVSPQPLSTFLGGKLLSGAVLLFVISLVGLVIGAVAFGLDITRLPLALLWSGFSGTALLSFFLLIQTFASSQRGGTLVTTIIVFPLIMLGGSFFPFEVMPEWMARIGRFTPNGLAVTRLKEMLMGQVELGALVGSATAIALAALIAVAWTARRIRTRFVTS